MIGVFDSGYGGLTVLKPLLEKLPGYDYIYLGDNARAPYGVHSPEKVQEFSEQAVDFLIEKGCKLIIVACNTASSAALRQLQNTASQKTLGVLIPAAEHAAEISPDGGVGVVATSTTIQSGVYEKEIKKIAPNARVYSQACPLLVPFIEEGWQDKPEAISILKKYLKPLKSKQIDSLILGCTHYPLMMKHFKRVMGAKTKIISSGDAAAEKLVDYLERHPEIEKELTRGGKREFYTTDSGSKFQKYVEKHLGLKLPKAHQVSIIPTQ